ncbi:hypothetical protein [Streptomyces sp. NPDC058755]|uniref:hypothetical protein n=1 Tax=Streptomyces sp. NPDC058755 TaxID=3346624 RepID=UPI0036B0AE1D
MAVQDGVVAVADVRGVLDVGVADVATTHDQHERKITDSHQPDDLQVRSWRRLT